MAIFYDRVPQPFWLCRPVGEKGDGSNEQQALMHVHTAPFAQVVQTRAPLTQMKCMCMLAHCFHGPVENIAQSLGTPIL